MQQPNTVLLQIETIRQAFANPLPATAAAVPARPLPTLDMVPYKKTQSFGELKRRSFRGVAVGLGAVAALMLLVGQTTIAGAVVTTGRLVVESGSKPIQHLYGGTVASVLVGNGDTVGAGQALLTLDQTVAHARLVASASLMLQNRIRLARLRAERDDLPDVEFAPFDPSHGLTQVEYEAIIASERSQFAIRHTARQGNADRLGEQIAQAIAQRDADTAQLAGVSEELALLEKELLSLRALYAKELVTTQRLSEGERSLSQLRGTEGALRSSVVSDEGRIAEARLAQAQAEQQFRVDLGDAINQAQGAEAELAQSYAMARDQFGHLAVLAPQAGVVHELKVNGPGEVVQPGQTLMNIVPRLDRLIGEIRISPNDIEQVYIGQEATVQFSGLDRATTPSVTGKLVEISPDLVEDQRTGAAFFTGRVEIDTAAAASELQLAPGMSVEVFVKTDDRTILSYMTKPLLDQINRTFR